MSESNVRHLRVLVALALAVTSIAAVAQPTSAQQSAIRSHCRGDFQAMCAGVQPGGQAALACLQQNAAKATPACQQALGAVGGGATAGAGGAVPGGGGGAAAAAAAPAAGAAMAPQGGGMQGGGMQGGMQGGGMGQMGMREELAITRQACGQDYRTYCQGVQPGGGRAITCLESNAQSLSPGCQKALLEMKQRMGK